MNENEFSSEELRKNEDEKLSETVEQQTIKRAIKKIVNRQIELPEKVTAEYLTGYAKCQLDIIDILTDMLNR